jgi:hypothetical protein
MPRGVLLLGVLALMVGAGCATPGSTAFDPTLTRDGAASPSTVQSLGCRNRGVYNRAADLCVSEGP